MSDKLPNLLGVHALVWVGGWSKSECEEAIKNTAETGYGLIEIPALDPKSIDVSHTLSVLKNYDIKSACSLGLSFDSDINNDDSEIVARGEKKLNDALDVVAALGGNYLGGVIYSALGKYKLPPLIFLLFLFYFLLFFLVCLLLRLIFLVIVFLYILLLLSNIIFILEFLEFLGKN